MLYLMSMAQGTLDRDVQLDVLIEKIASQDMEAFARLYSKTKSAVFGYALSILKNPYEAEDVSQDVYLSILSSAAGYKSSGKPMAWVVTITKNHCMQRIRSSRRLSTISIDDLESYLISRPVSTAEDRIIIESALTVLSDTDREIVLLHILAGMKHREISGLLGIALPTVLSKYNRALKKMKVSLEKGE